MGEAVPEIALVVCTRNRSDYFEPFFDAIRKMERLPEWELILVDNGSTDKTALRLQEFANFFPGRAKVVSEPKPGLGRARNAGWRASTAPLVVFTDDDCYPDAKFLQEMQAVFADESVGFAGGRILLFDPSDARVTIEESNTPRVLQPGKFAPTGFLHGANMAFRRQALIAINGFDDNFGAGTPFACEDIDAVLRVSAAGWKGKYDPRPIVYHHHRRKNGPEIDTLWESYDLARGAYYMKCVLSAPQRWQCMWHWVKSIRREPFVRTKRELGSAYRYYQHRRKQKPNAAN